MGSGCPELARDAGSPPLRVAGLCPLPSPGSPCVSSGSWPLSSSQPCPHLPCWRPTGCPSKRCPHCSAPAFREPSLAPLATRFVPWITRRLAAPVGRREALMALAMAMVVMVMDMDMDMDMDMVMARGAPTKQLSQGTPTPNTSTKELVELTLRQEPTPMPLLTKELSSPTLLIPSLQLSLAMLSSLNNRNKAVCKL